jgi:hypothetical protein
MPKVKEDIMDDAIRVTVRKQQKTSLRTGVLQTQAHDGGDQLPRHLFKSISS